eukprot:CAMPEP_0198650016 /NCGR_PEP_ID=MMETSP1467-20131203/4672_1 /TAXON_ID=1462469 /ORGANISM="unid. sp., Strain CCMP2135" /LENGTH=997 /DNA_ID=CAMNT_0044385839 /DNA_START=19 /DNA_END=3012 /DNA_ORIENTATION=-
MRRALLLWCCCCGVFFSSKGGAAPPAASIQQSAELKTAPRQPRLLVSLENGEIVTLDAWSGREVGRFASGGPLAKPSGNLVPNVWDGLVYLVEENGRERKFVDAVEFADRDVPEMQCLREAFFPETSPLAPQEKAQCGLMYGERLRKVIAVDVSTGHVLWQHDTLHGSSPPEAPPQGGVPALLQRDEYVLRVLDAADGVERLNVSLSTITAFGPSTEDDTTLLPRVEVTAPRELRAVHDSTVLWSLSLPCAPTDLFAARGDGVWTKVVVDVVEPPKHLGAPPEPDEEKDSRLVPFVTRADSLGLGEQYSRDQYDKPMLAPPPSFGGGVLLEDATSTKKRSLSVELSPTLIVEFLLALVAGVASTVWVVLRHDRKRRSTSEDNAVRALPKFSSTEQQHKNYNRASSTRSLGSMLDRLRHHPLPMSQQHPLVSANRYEAEFEQKERLGDGGFGTVHRAVNRLDAKEYAIKKIQIRGNKLRDKILREVKILAGLDHPNIVRYYQAWLEHVDEFPPDNKGTSQRPSSSSNLLFGGVDDLDDLDDATTKTADLSRCLNLNKDCDDDDCCVDWTDDERGSHDDDDDDDDEEGQEDDPEWDALPSCEDGDALPSFDLVAQQLPSRVSLPSQRGRKRPHRKRRRCQTSSREKASRPQHLETRKVSETSSSSNNEFLLLYIQMQLCSAQTLREHLDRRAAGRCMLADEALNIFAQACRGLKYVHARDLIHRDLKPANIFLNTDGGVKIGDFGLSRVAKHHHADGGEGGGDDDEEGSSLNNDDDFDDDDDDDDRKSSSAKSSSQRDQQQDVTAGVGTRLYAAPEQLTSEDYDEKVDIYSLGVVLFEMLRPRFDTAMERFVVLGSLPDAAADALRQRLDAAPPRDLTELVAAMVRKDPLARPSASAANDAVDTILDRGLVQSLHLENPQLTKVVLRNADGDLRIYNSDGVVLQSENHHHLSSSGDSSVASAPADLAHSPWKSPGSSPPEHHHHFGKHHGGGSGAQSSH